MKSSLYVTALESGDSRVAVPDALLSAFSLRSNDLLYAVMVPRSAELLGKAPSPCATMYASPFSYRAWDRLIGASFTTGPGPGTAAHLSESLQQLNLYPRPIETAETRPLDDKADASSPTHVIGPDTTTVLEVPLPESLRTLEPTISLENASLHENLHRLVASNTPISAESCLTILRQRLTALAVAAPHLSPSPHVDSLNPLRALNQLGRQLTNEAGRKLYREISLETKKDVRKRTCIPCDAWRAVLWPESRNVVEEASHPHGLPMAVIVSFDTDEHVITLQFYRLSGVLIASFDMVVPASGLEQRWWRWIYEEIASAHGTVLGHR